MENKFQKEFEYAEYLLEAARQIPHTLLDSKFKNQNPKGKSLHQKLLELYVEECGKQPVGKVCEALVYGSNLLQKLVRRDKLHCVVLNLYPANEGYSLLLRGRNGVETETIKLPYEESELLEYIDASELPPVLVDLLDKSRVNVFYSGCVIVEVRDFRRSATGNIDPVFVLLRPTPQSMLADINALTNDGRRWSQDDQFQLESQLLLETEEPLCLDPSPAVYVVTNRLQYERKKFNTPLLLRNVKKYSQAAVNRKRKFAHGPAPKELMLHDFLHRKKEKLKQPPPVNLKVGKSNVDMWKQRPVNLTVPESVETERFAKALEKPKHSSSDNVPVLIEECSLEREGPQGRCVCYRVSIYRRPSDLFYLGELYMDHDYVEGQKKGTVCRFPLGLQANAEKYVKQLEEMFTEKGALLAKITRSVPGHPPQVSIPPTVPASTGSAPSQTTAQALMAHAAGLASAITAQVEGGSVSVGGKKLKPLHLSTSSTGNLVSPQTTPTLTSPIGITTTQLTNQMTINIQHPLQPTAGQSHAIGRHRHSSRSMGTPSPVSSSVPAAQLPSYSEAVAGQPGSHKPSSTPTPPPLVKTGSVRRGSVTETFTTTIGAAPDGGVTPPSLGQQAVAPNVNIANIPGLAANINIQNLANLQGMNLTNLQGLGNMQVSLTGVSVPGGGIAVPVPINMINTSSSILQNQGIIVSSLPSQTTGVTASTSNSAINTTSQINAPHVTSPTTYVTMVTAMPAATGTSSSVSSTSSTSTAVSSGVITNPTSVLAGPQQNMLQVPINVTGNLAQFVPHLKTIRGHPGLPLLQLQGQQGIQVLNLQQQQRLQAQLPQSAAGTPAQGTTTSAASNAPPTSGVLTGQSLSGKAGQPTTLTQQLIQLNQPGGFPSQLQIPRPFHFHPMPTQKHSAPPKTKSKKRATPTPPKN